MEFIIDEKLVEDELITSLLGEGKQLTSILISSRKTEKKRKI